jgi:hypothetical protein
LRRRERRILGELWLYVRQEVLALQRDSSTE